MPNVVIEFQNCREVSARMTYEKKPGDGGKTTLRFSSEKIKDQDGQPKVFSMSFNNIGKTPAHCFYYDLDEGYLNDKVRGLRSSEIDFFKTIENVRQTASDPDSGLSAKDINDIEETIDRVACSFEGDHALSSEQLIRSLMLHDLPCFQDAPGSFVGHRMTSEARIFHMEVWEDLNDAIDDYLDDHPEVDDMMLNISRDIDIEPEPDELSMGM
jgi:hypothetical protein